MSPKKEKKSSHPLYVGIQEKKELRINLLESSRTIISSMQSYQRILDMQKHKEDLKNKMKEDVKEIRMLISRLEEAIPENPTARKEVKEAYQAKKNIIEPSKDAEIDSELDKIHSYISDIEQRLKSVKQ